VGWFRVRKSRQSTFSAQLRIRELASPSKVSWKGSGEVIEPGLAT
jgi:hypothetical protein